MSEIVETPIKTTPTKSLFLRVPNDTLDFNVHLFEGGGDAWSFKRLQKPEDGRQPIGLALDEAMVNMSAANIYLPSPVKFNAQIVDPEDLKVVIPLGPRGYRWAYRNSAKPADTTWLDKQGDAFGFSGGGCALFAIFAGGFFFVGHAGRDSVIDRVRVETLGKEKDRDYEGVAEAVVKKFALSPAQLAQAHAWIFWSIPACSFPHEKEHEVYGTYNRALPEYARRWYDDPLCVLDYAGSVYPDVARIFAAQCRKLGMDPNKIHMDNAELPQGVSHTRDGSNGRYFAAIVRRS